MPYIWMHQRSTLEMMLASVGGSGDASAFPPGVYTRVYRGGSGAEDGSKLKFRSI